MVQQTILIQERIIGHQLIEELLCLSVLQLCELLHQITSPRPILIQAVRRPGRLDLIINLVVVSLSLVSLVGLVGLVVSVGLILGLRFRLRLRLRLRGQLIHTLLDRVMVQQTILIQERIISHQLI
ncbi:hypothetical protein BCY76_006065, partial [Nesterenkonia sp. PF2B19]